MYLKKAKEHLIQVFFQHNSTLNIFIALFYL